MSDMAAEKRTRRKSFKCSTCKKAFNAKSALNVHMKIHSAQRPYKYTVMRDPTGVANVTSALNKELA